MNVVVADVLKLVVNTNSLTLILGPVHGYLYNYGIFAEGQLTVTSNRSWGLTVHSSGPNLVNGTETVPVENLNIGYMQGIALSTLPQSLAFSQPPVQGENLTLVYSVAMSNQAFLKPGGTYSTTLTYMIAYE